MPESRKQLEKFIKDQNREFKNFIEATTECERSGGDMEYDSGDDMDFTEETENYLAESDNDCDSEEELLESNEMF